MRWPWVSRAEYERVQRLYADENKAYCAASVEATRFQTQVQQLTHALANATNALTALQAQEAARAATVQRVASQRSQLTQAIREQARMPDGSLDRRLLDFLRAKANALILDATSDGSGVTDELIRDVIGRIQSWESSEHGTRRMTADSIASMSEL